MDQPAEGEGPSANPPHAEPADAPSGDLPAADPESAGQHSAVPVSVDQIHSAPPSNPLDGFLSAADAFVENSFAALGRSVGHTRDSILLESNVETLILQFRRMTDEVRRAHGNSSARMRPELDAFVDLQQGGMLAFNSERTAAAVMAKGVDETFLIWLARNLLEIKKIIRMILRRIFNEVPSWYDDIALLVDSLAHGVLSLFASLSGLNGARVASELSASEQSFWAEMAAMDRVVAMRRQIRRTNED